MKVPHFGILLNVWKVLYKKERGLFRLDLVMCFTLWQALSGHEVNSEQKVGGKSLPLFSLKFGEVGRQ